jgi:hypothetical protein
MNKYKMVLYRFFVQRRLSLEMVSKDASLCSVIKILLLRHINYFKKLAGEKTKKTTTSSASAVKGIPWISSRQYQN